MSGSTLRFDNIAARMVCSTVVAGAGVAFLWARVSTALWQTLALFSVVSIAGSYWVDHLSHRLEDHRLKRLSVAFLVKLLLVLFVLYAGWVPQLNPDSDSYGYDPQRYYFQASDLANAGFSLENLPSLNYTGILFYYGMMFAVFGHNPAIPALINCFVTLIATLMLVRMGYELKRQRSTWDWILGLSMLLPEILWFDAITARETLVMSLLVIGILSIAGYFIHRPGDRFSLLGAALSLPALTLLGIVRLPALIPALASIIILFPLLRLPPRRRLYGIVLIAFAAVVFLVAPTLSQALGAYQLNYAQLVEWVSSRDEAFLETVTWSDRSFGQMLIPDNRVQAVLFVPVRLLFYLVAPLPKVDVGLSGLAAGEWAEWQTLMTGLSALVYAILLPMAFAAFIQAMRSRKDRNALVFHVPCWVALLTIAAGNQIIQERYRIMAALFFLGCAWLGRTCGKRLLITTYAAWAAVVAFGGLIYVGYKFVP
jgi:hypothetical protein